MRRQTFRRLFQPASGHSIAESRRRVLGQRERPRAPRKAIEICQGRSLPRRRPQIGRLSLKFNAPRWIGPLGSAAEPLITGLSWVDLEYSEGVCLVNCTNDVKIDAPGQVWCPCRIRQRVSRRSLRSTRRSMLNAAATVRKCRKVDFIDRTGPRRCPASGHQSFKVGISEHEASRDECDRGRRFYANTRTLNVQCCNVLRIAAQSRYFPLDNTYKIHLIFIFLNLRVETALPEAPVFFPCRQGQKS
ncbi:hypothetical protein B0G84_8085 [Paraburkholderia sp. BL8N3]|nr:hypothetical protein B0G84_8085 [Paraburkholderia sp. BL8N3]